MFGQIAPALRMLAMLTLLTGVAYPFLMTGLAQVAFPHAANGSLIVAGDKIAGLGSHRTAVRRSEVLLEPPVGDLAAAVQRRVVERLEPGPAQSCARRRGEGSGQGAARRGSRQHAAGAGRSRHRIGKRARSGHQHGVRLLSSRARRRSARPHCRAGEDADRAAHERPHLWRPGRAPRQRAGVEPRTRPVTEVAALRWTAPPAGIPWPGGARFCGAPPGKL